NRRRFTSTVGSESLLDPLCGDLLGNLALAEAGARDASRPPLKLRRTCSSSSGKKHRQDRQAGSAERPAPSRCGPLASPARPHGGGAAGAGPRHGSATNTSNLSASANRDRGVAM